MTANGLSLDREQTLAKSRVQALVIATAGTDDAAGAPEVDRDSAAPAAVRPVPSIHILPMLGIAAALWWGQAVLIPIVMSMLISYALEPLVVRLVSWRLSRAWAVPLVLASLLGACGAGAYGLRNEALTFVTRLPEAAHTVAKAIQGAKKNSPETMAKVQQAARELESATSTPTPKDAKSGVTAVRIEEPTFKWSNWLWQGSYGAVGFAGQMFAVLCLVYCLLLAGDLYKRKLVRIVPRLADKKITVEILAEIDRQIERFLLARVALSAIIGVAIWLSFRLIGLEEAGIWGVLSAILFAIPFIGPGVVMAGATMAAFVQFGSFGMASAIAAACIVIAALEGNILTPWLMSRVGEMNAMAVFVSLLFWGWIWGIWGLLLAVPITVAAKAVCERVPNLHAFAELLRE